VTLGLAEIPERIAYAREPRRLPVVLSADEVVRFLEALPSLKARAALTTAYAAGLRVSEVTGLRVGDIVPEARLRHDDSGRMLIRIEHGKGGGGKPLIESDPTLASDLRNLVEPATLGSPVQPLLWVSKSREKLAREAQLRRQQLSHRVGADRMPHRHERSRELLATLRYPEQRLHG
jgi:integrase